MISCYKFVYVCAYKNIENELKSKKRLATLIPPFCLCRDWRHFSRVFQYARGKTVWRRWRCPAPCPPRNRVWCLRTSSAVPYRLFLRLEQKKPPILELNFDTPKNIGEKIALKIKTWFSNHVWVLNKWPF